MTASRFGRLQKATALVPLALLSTAWTASLAGAGATSAADRGPTLPDGTSVPTQALEDPASYSAPGMIGLGVQGSGDSVVQAASTNGIPSAALAAYQRAETVINAADKACNIDWQLIAAIGRVESDHGRYGGNTLGTDGVSRPGIYGIPLDGTNNTQAISDSDAGQFDRDTTWDRAVGPMQFIPSTWSVVGVDADGDSKRNPQDIDDAALASAVYLCSGDDDLATDAGRRAAVYRYNHSQAYVNLVLRIMEAYLAGDYTAVPNSTTSAVSFTPDYSFYNSSAPRPTLARPEPARPASGGTTGGSNGGTTGGSGGQTGGDNDGDGTPTVPGTPTEPTPTGSLGDTLTGVVDGVTGGLTGGGDTGGTTEPTEPATGTVTNTLTWAEAQTQCLASGISALNVTALTTCINNLLAP